jgi:hypothetical protein
MKYFLVEGIVNVIEYMGDEHSFKETRLVEAETEQEASDKYVDYWERQTVEYSTYYHARANVKETIR